MIDDECIQTIINKYFEQNNIMVNHLIQSYDDYIDTIFPNILSQFFPLIIHVKSHKIKKISVHLDDYKINDPYFTENNGCRKIMTPYIARLRNYTYSFSFTKRD